MLSFSRLARLCIAALVGVAAGIFAAAAPASAETIGFQIDQPQPNVGDGVRLETDALQKPPYDAGGYEVWFWFCRDTPENCRAGGRWFRVPVTNNLGDPVRPMQAYVCTGGRCTLRVRLTNPREATYTFVAAVYRGGQRVAQSKGIKVTWTKPGPPPPPRTGDVSFPTLTLRVGGVSCTARMNVTPRSVSDGRVLFDRCDAELTLPRGADGSGLAVEASFTVYPGNAYRLSRILYWGHTIPCPGAGASFCTGSTRFPTPNRGRWLNTVQIEIERFGEPLRIPANGNAVPTFTAIIYVNFR